MQPSLGVAAQRKRGVCGPHGRDSVTCFRERGSPYGGKLLLSPHNPSPSRPLHSSNYRCFLSFWGSLTGRQGFADSQGSADLWQPWGTSDRPLPPTVELNGSGFHCTHIHIHPPPNAVSEIWVQIPILLLISPPILEKFNFSKPLSHTGKWDVYMPGMVQACNKS